MSDYDWGQGLKGGAGGFMAGNAIVPGIGGAVGLGLGLLGGFGGGESDQDKQHRQMLQNYYNQLGGRQAPQFGNVAQGGMSSFRNNQSDLVGRLEALSRGEGPSLAAQQFQQATDRNMASQQAMAQSGRGGPLAAFNAANNMGQLGAQAAQGSAMARVQEQQMALQQLGLTLHGARGADEDMNRFNAGQRNNASGMNLQSKLQTMGNNDQARLQLLSQMGGLNSRQASQPGLGDQLLAGGAGLASFYATNRAQNAGQGSGNLPSDAQLRNQMGYGTMGANGLMTPMGW